MLLDMLLAIDVDGMLLSYPKFFQAFFPAMQAAGSKVGILTGRPESQKDTLTEQLKALGIAPDFFVAKPDDSTLPNGAFKAIACRDLGIDVLFDDFQCDDPAMLAEFFSRNQKTIPFISWALQP
jgi:hypothetical protein